MDVHGWPPSNLKGAVQSLRRRVKAFYLLPFFFGAAFFDGAGFFLLCEAEPPRFPPKATSQPSEYRLFGPTRVIVTFPAPKPGGSIPPRLPGASWRLIKVLEFIFS